MAEGDASSARRPGPLRACVLSLAALLVLTGCRRVGGGLFERPDPVRRSKVRLGMDEDEVARRLGPAPVKLRKPRADGRLQTTWIWSSSTEIWSDCPDDVGVFAGAGCREFVARPALQMVFLDGRLIRIDNAAAGYIETDELDTDVPRPPLRRGGDDPSR